MRLAVLPFFADFFIGIKPLKPAICVAFGALRNPRMLIEFSINIVFLVCMNNMERAAQYFL